MPAKKRSPSLKTAVYEQIARIGHAAASPSRLELLDLLSQSSRTVEALARQTGQSVAATSHHLQVLRRARLVDAEKAGLYGTLPVICRVPSQCRCQTWPGVPASFGNSATSWRTAAGPTA